jgi:hypothetical protein
MALMSEPVVSLQDDTRKQLGAFLRARRESLDPQRSVCRAAVAAARRVCAGKRWRCSLMWA